MFNERNVARVIHAGDLISPFTLNEFQKLSMPLTCVFGNNDGELLGLKARFQDIHVPPLEMDIEGRKLVVLHEPDCLEAVVASQTYDVVIYGHTHQVDIRQDTPTVVINPGEACCWLTGSAQSPFWIRSR